MAELEEQEDGEWTLTMVLGDSAEITLTAVDDAATPAAVDLSKAVDGTADFPAIVRFSVKDDPEAEENADGMAFLASYNAAQIEVLDQTDVDLVGQFTIRLDKPDTQDRGNPDSSYRWDVEVSRQGDLRSGASAGTAAVDADGVVTGTGTAFESARPGDIFQVASGPNDGLSSIILSIADDSVLVLENPELAVASGFTFTIRRGVHKTLRRGAFILLESVVR